MKLDAFKPAPPVSESVPTHEPPASQAAASQLGGGEQSSPSPAPQEEQYTTSVTPNGVEIYYSWAPRRHYKLRGEVPSVVNGSFDGDWREVPSVTNVLGVLEKPQLVWWGMKVGVEGCIELSQKQGYDIGECAVEELVDALTQSKLTVNHQRDKAADRGVNVHGALEDWVKCGALPDSNERPENERGYVQGLYEFLCAISYVADHNEVQAELMVGSLEHSYAGRADLWLTLSKPVEVTTKIYPKRKPRVKEIPAGRYLLDLKTSKGIYNTHYLQLEAYEAAAVECGYAPTDHRGVIHVTADGRYELALNKDWCFDDFLAVRRCYQVLNEREVLRVLREDLDAKEVS